jgi:hypothetical protein
MKTRLSTLMVVFLLAVSNMSWSQVEIVDVVKVGEFIGGVVHMTIDEDSLNTAFELAFDDGIVFTDFELEYRHDTTITLIGFGYKNDSSVVFAIETWTTDLGSGYETYLVRQFNPYKVTCTGTNCETGGCIPIVYTEGEYKGAPYDCSGCSQGGSHCRKVIEYRGGFLERLFDGLGSLATTLTISLNAGGAYRR